MNDMVSMRKMRPWAADGLAAADSALSALTALGVAAVATDAVVDFAADFFFAGTAESVAVQHQVASRE